MPELSREFLCILDRSATALAASISSYLYRADTYLPIFEFPVTRPEYVPGMEEIQDEDSIMRTQAEEFNVLVGNAIRKIGGVENLILAGLSEEQKSYLDFLNEFNVIEVDGIQEVDFKLGAFSQERSEYFYCHPDNYLIGLFQAVKNRAKLVIEEQVGRIDVRMDGVVGIVLIEQIDAVASVIAMNYALSIGATVTVVPALEQTESEGVTNLIDRWRRGEDLAFNELSAKVKERTIGIDFMMYEFATCFTVGLPYSLIHKNIIPFSYIHLLARPDLFLFNNLVPDTDDRTDAAVVFSPQFFKDEEVGLVSSILGNRGLLVREMLGEQATVYNLEMHLTEFPYDIFHICSHGGEVAGVTVTESFFDRDGVKHIVEYYRVRGYSTIPGGQDVKITTLYYWRKFDGIAWKSDEFRQSAFSNYIFVDMLESIKRSKKENIINKTPVHIVPGSISIKAHDFVYLPSFDGLASYHKSPFIFNNTCWSGRDIVSIFLNAGARGYVGTLWEVDEACAADMARAFYHSVDQSTIVNALKVVLENLRGTASEDIYIFWGLHSSKLQRGRTVSEGKSRIAALMMDSFYRWRNKEKLASSERLKKAIKVLSDWHFNQLFTHFEKECRALTKNSLRGKTS